jgi:hypothetical protein
MPSRTARYTTNRSFSLPIASTGSRSDTWICSAAPGKRGQLEQPRDQLIDRYPEATKAAKGTKAARQGVAPEPICSTDGT